MLLYFLGPEASYTHQAALKYSSSADKRAYTSIPAVFDAVRTSQSQKDALGIIPVENSTNGPVAATLDLLASNAADAQAVCIIAEVRVRVQHCLLARRPPGSSTAAPPDFRSGARPDLTRVTSIHTHPQAWTQCSRFLSHYGLIPPGKPVPASAPSAQPAKSEGQRAVCQDAPSTSSAAALAASDPTGATGAISSSLAAEAHDLDILLSGLEDSAGNVTRFFVLSSTSPATDTAPRVGQDGPHKALLTFQLAPASPAPHSKPGSLSGALGVFSAHGLNLSSINTRPRGGNVPWEYCFIVEVELAPGMLANRVLDRTMADLKDVVGECRLRGVWSVSGIDV